MEVEIEKKAKILHSEFFPKECNSTLENSKHICYQIAKNIHLDKNYKKKTLYIDMDGVIVDFQSGIDQLSPKEIEDYKGNYDEVPGIFSTMKPIEGAISTIKELDHLYDIYALSTASWYNPTAWSDKLLWIKKYLPDTLFKRLILSHNKHLNIGEYLIDDRTKNGAGEFPGTLIQFKTTDPNNWKNTKEFLHKEFIKNAIKDYQIDDIK
ncbi:MAG: hypothetical protein WBG43_01640 [Marinifilaceae bacterium]